MVVFYYTATAIGGTGGLRFSTSSDFHQFNDKPFSRKVCGNDDVTMVISKLNPTAHVSVDINGVKYEFLPNQKHDVLKNNWYRRSLTLKLTK